MKKLNKIKLKLNFEKFFKETLWVYLLVIGSIYLCAYIFNRYIEATMFCIAHICIRISFNKQYHLNKTAYCLSLTLAIIWFSIPITMPLTISLLSSIPIAFVICFLGFLAQDRVDLIHDIKHLEKQSKELIEKLNHKDIYAMNEKELYEHCRNCGLSEEDCRLAYLIVIERLHGRELYDAMGYCERHCKRKRTQILTKIK